MVRGRTVEQRLTDAERQIEDVKKHVHNHAGTLTAHNTTISAQEKILVDVAQRVTSIETARQARKEEEIRREEREVARNNVVDTRLSSIEDDLADIKGNVKWATRIIVSAVLVAIVTFALKGGGFAP